ncbi:MAG: Cna B-type domain-containing protein [Lachnospiraceae bacterium]|nr:Cna B-type domain-containing protein [Lachnospiraceae bacterium]
MSVFLAVIICFVTVNSLILPSVAMSSAKRSEGVYTDHNEETADDILMMTETADADGAEKSASEEAEDGSEDDTFAENLNAAVEAAYEEDGSAGDAGVEEAAVEEGIEEAAVEEGIEDAAVEEGVETESSDGYEEITDASNEAVEETVEAEDPDSDEDTADAATEDAVEAEEPDDTGNPGETEDMEAAEEAVEAEDEEEAAAFPAQFFEAHTDHVSVRVDAEEGALPAGVTMEVTEVTDEDTIDSVRDAALDHAGNAEVQVVRAVDISFVTEQGEKAEPLFPVRVFLTSDLVEKSENPVVVHMDDEGETEVVELLEEPDLHEELAADQIAFDSERFSVYAIVGTVIETTILASDGNLYDVAVHCNDDAQIPEGSSLRVTEIERGTRDYINAYRLLFNDEPYEEAPMMAVDIAIIDPAGREIEPESAVTVDLRVKSLPDGADTEEMRESIAVNHMKEVPGGVIVETVASGSEIMVSDNIETSFVVDSFSQFNITWNNNGTHATVRVHYVDEDGNDLNGQRTTNINYTNNSATYYFADYATQNIDDASYIEARYGSISGNIVTSVNFARSGSWLYGYTYTTTFYNGSRQVSSSTTNQTYDVYLIYENTTPGLTISKTSTGATTPADASFTVSSTDGEYTRTFTYADMTSGKIKFEDAPVGKTYTVTESGGERNGYILTTSYGNNVTLTESRPSGTLTVSNAYANDPNVVKVYVYVAAYDQEGNQFKNNPEFLELLGISGDTVDGNGYFPVGEIYIDKSFFNGKTTSKWAALINSSSDWEQVLAALGELDTSTLIYDLGVDYSLNQGNNVGDYMDQAIGDVNKGAGSQCTALFGWSGHSYGFEDQSVEYHLDLRFQTNKVTFITGHNGITSGASRDGTTVDVRAYIQGSSIQQPRNLVIPAGYRLVGYYNDPDFTTPWNKIGTPITQDEVAYIKITPQENVILHYKPVPAGGGTVSLDAEGLNPVTGTPVGSTAAANPGYVFAGWYADEECTQLLSTDAAYVPTRNSNEQWVDGTTYYARFLENTVTLTFKAEDHIDHLEMNSVPENVVSYEFSDDRKTLTVVLEAASGSPVTVTGIPENGYAVKEWTIDGRSGNLTTNDSLTTSKTDDPAATNGLWTDRTYHVWSEVLKTITVTKEVNIIGTLEEEDVDVTVYFALKDLSQNPAPWVYRSDGSIYTISIQIVDGVPQGTAAFADLPAGTYEVWEVADADANSLEPGSELAPGIVVSRIQTWITDTDTGNDVVLTDDDPDGSIKVINTLNHAGEAMTFWANKKWFTVKNSYTDANAEANVDVPAGAWVDFTLYRVYADGREEEVQTIRLDGTANAVGEEDPWAAAFRDLPTVDDDGDPVSYYVKETAVSDLSAFDYYTTFNDTTFTNGGSISNVAAYGDVNVTKEIELPADISAEDKQAFIDALTISVTGPAEVAESRRVTRTLDKNSFSITESAKTSTYGQTTQPVIVLTLTAAAEDLPAGTYTVSETGYNDSSLAYQWDSAHSWMKSDKLPEDRSSMAGIEQYGEISLDVPVGINVTDGNFTTTVNLFNSYVVQNIRATKVWDDLGKENASHPSVSLTLYRTDGNGNKTAVSTQIIGANQTGNNLTLTWMNQPQTYTYSVGEAPVEGYSLQSITGNAAEGFVVTNTRAPIIKAVKTDQAGKPLAGAAFSGDLITDTIITEVTGEEGSEEAIILNDISVPVGTYTISEDAAPAGYMKLENPVTISVEQGEAVGDLVVRATLNGETSDFVKAERPDVTNHPDYWVITIRNDAGIELPATGGPGTGLICILGWILTVLAGAGLMVSKRRRNGV